MEELSADGGEGAGGSVDRAAGASNLAGGVGGGGLGTEGPGGRGCFSQEVLLAKKGERALWRVVKSEDPAGRCWWDSLVDPGGAQPSQVALVLESLSAMQEM